MNHQAIQAIVFDFGNTLCPWDEKQYSEVTRKTLERVCSYAGNHDPDAAYEVFSRIRDDESHRKLSRLVESDLASVLANTAREIVGRELEPLEMDELMNAHLNAFIGVCRAPDGLHSMLDRLSQKYRLAVLSNYPMSECIRRSMDSLGIADFFEATLVSGDLGVIKPNPRIFDQMLSTLDLPPESVLFVGDDRIADVVGACSSGIPCVHILEGNATRKAKMMEGVFGIYLRKALELPEFSRWEEATPVVTLESVLELEDWLEGRGA